MEHPKGVQGLVRKYGVGMCLVVRLTCMTGVLSWVMVIICNSVLDALVGVVGGLIPGAESLFYFIEQVRPSGYNL